VVAGPELGARRLKALPAAMPHIRRILCPIDFSEISRHALDHAVALAKWYGAALEVLYVHTTSMPILVAAPLPFVRPAALDNAERATILQAMAEYVADDRSTGVKVDTVLEEHHDIAGAIVARAASWRAELIVLGTHGRSGWQRLVLGSIAEKVLRKAQCPVLTVPPRAQQVIPGAVVAIERIVCPIDFSPASTRALRHAMSLARQAGTGARLTVAHIIELPPDVPEPPLPEFSASRALRFEQARRSLRDALPARLRTVCDIDQLLLVGKPYKEILRLAEEQQADVIVMGVQGRGAADLLFFGSTTQHVVRAARCPVLTVRQMAP
jgi:nucleotide-binding universal stress UspA family protein